MTFSLSHGVRVRQLLAFLKGWLNGKSGRVWSSELVGNYTGAELKGGVADLAQATAMQLQETASQFDSVAAYKQELDALYALQRDTDYQRRSRRWLWQRAAHTRAAGHLVDWSGYSRRNPSTKVMVAARAPLATAETIKIETVVGQT